MKKINFINYVNIELNQTKLVLDFAINPIILLIEIIMKLKKRKRKFRDK